jgi:hypothetical protein
MWYTKRDVRAMTATQRYPPRILASTEKAKTTLRSRVEFTEQWVRPDTHLTNVGLAHRARAITNWLRPFAAPSEAGLGQLLRTNINFALSRSSWCEQASSEGEEITNEKHKDATPEQVRRAAMPTQRAIFCVVGSLTGSLSWVFSSSRAITLRTGIRINTSGHKPMQNMYNRPMSNLRKRCGARRSCNSRNIADDMDRLYPISAT